MMKRNMRTAAMPPAETRAAPAPQPPAYVVVRAWPGVHNGQRVELRPDRAKRLLRAGFVKVE